MIKNHRELHPLYRACAVLAGLAFIAGCASAPGDVAPKTASGWVKDEVSDSYVFGYPLVQMDIAREAAIGTGPGQADLDTLRHAQALPPVGAANPPLPNLDTLASSGWLDVGSEPVLVTLPDTHGRYMDVRALDMWTNIVWSSGAQITARSAGLKSQTIAFVPAGWKGTLPARVQRVDVGTRYVWFVARIETRGGDLAAIRTLQRAMRVAPLSAWSASPGRASTAPAAAGVIGDQVAPGSPGSPRAKVAALAPTAWFDRLAQALADNPPVPDDPHALKILADLGVRPGDAGDPPKGSSELFTAGFADGRERLATPPSNLLTGNGWTWAGDAAGTWGTDYALRAWAAYTTPALGTRDDEVRARVSVDSDGHVLNGANRYVIHFAPNQLPPVRGFWSLTAYTPDGALADDTPVRVALGDRTGAHRNRDGSLDVRVSAGRQKSGNWVPAPHGDFVLVLRLYAPKRQATDGSWQPPAVERQ